MTASRTATRTATRRILATAVIAPAAALALGGTAHAETPAPQPAPFQIVLPAEPVQPAGPADLAIAPQVDPEPVDEIAVPKPPAEPKPPVGPADLADDVSDPGPHPQPEPELPIGPAPVDPGPQGPDDLVDAPDTDDPSVPDDKLGPNQGGGGGGVDGPDDLTSPESDPVIDPAPQDGTDQPSDESTGDGVEPTDGSSFGEGTSTSSETASPTSSLPFTGTSTWVLTALGLGLTAAGVAAQRVARARA